MFDAAYWLDKAARLLCEADNVGLWLKSDDCSDNRRKRELLREADWAASSALRETDASSPLNGELRALVSQLEPLPDLVTDTRLSSPELDSRISAALETIERLKDRAAALPPHS